MPLTWRFLRKPWILQNCTLKISLMGKRVKANPSKLFNITRELTKTWKAQGSRLAGLRIASRVIRNEENIMTEIQLTGTENMKVKFWALRLWSYSGQKKKMQLATEREPHKVSRADLRPTGFLFGWWKCP